MFPFSHIFERIVNIHDKVENSERKPADGHDGSDADEEHHGSLHPVHVGLFLASDDITVVGRGESLVVLGHPNLDNFTTMSMERQNSCVNVTVPGAPCILLCLLLRLSQLVGNTESQCAALCTPT